jgi:hypothetical protein
VVAVLIAGLIALPADTTLRVSEGDRLVLGTRDGSISVGVWDRSEVELEGRASLRRDGSTIRLGDEAGGRPRRAHLRVTIPEWLAVEIRGEAVEVVLDGVRGAEVRTYSGEVVLRATRDVDVNTISGDVEAVGVEGGTRVSTISGDITMAGVAGRLEARSTDGDIELVQVEAEELVAETTDGDVLFEGVILAGSRIRLATHDGDVTARIPPDSNVEVSVSTFDGAFIPGFPVRASGLRAGEAVTFVLGAGGARLEMQAFDGDLRLEHAGRGSRDRDGRTDHQTGG